MRCEHNLSKSLEIEMRIILQEESFHWKSNFAIGKFTKFKFR